MFDKDIEIDMYSLNTGPSEIEIFCRTLFVMIVGFAVGFMVGVSY